MSDDAKDRASRWLKLPDHHWVRGVASDVLALEQRLAALEANRQATPDGSPAGDGEWRDLVVGEILEAGDQLEAGGEWTDIHPDDIGSKMDDWGRGRRRVKPATPARDGDALRRSNDALRSKLSEARAERDLHRKNHAITTSQLKDALAENQRLRQRLAAPIDVEAFRGEFEKWFKLNYRDRGMENWDPFRDGIYWLAARLNAAARKEVAGE